MDPHDDPAIVQLLGGHDDGPGDEDGPDDDLADAYRRLIEECRNDPRRACLVPGFERKLALLEEEATPEESLHPVDRLVRLAGTVADGDLWPQLEAYGRLLDLLPDLEQALVAEARFHAIPWSVIAAGFGRSRQAVHRRYADDPEIPDPQPD